MALDIIPRANSPLLRHVLHAIKMSQAKRYHYKTKRVDLNRTRTCNRVNCLPPLQLLLLDSGLKLVRGPDRNAALKAPESASLVQIETERYRIL